MSTSSSSRGTVLITGGARRLGLVFAIQCIEMGFDLVLHYHTDKEEAERLIAHDPNLLRRISFLRADLANVKSDLVLRAMKMRERLCGIINNAAIFTSGSVSDESHLRSMLEINALVPLRLANSFRSHVRYGWIINITDAHINGYSLRFQNYQLSKKLLEELTRQMALAYAPHIRVNAIAPGLLLPPPSCSIKDFNTIAKSVPLCKTGDLQSLRQALAYLITNQYVTGETLFVDGGWHLITSGKK